MIWFFRIVQITILFLLVYLACFSNSKITISTGIPPLEYKDLVSILLTAIGVILTAVTIVLGVAAVYGYNQIKTSAEIKAEGTARDMTTKLMGAFLADIQPLLEALSAKASKMNLGDKYAEAPKGDDDDQNSK